MTPEDLAKDGSEHAHQRAIFAWANQATRYGFGLANNPMSYDHRTREACWERPAPVPQLAGLFAIHNQGHGDKVRGGRAKAEGVKRGVPDMMLPVPVGGLCGLFLELKLPKYKNRKDGGRSLEQIEWAERLREQSYRVVTAYGWQEAVSELVRYLKGE